MTDDLMGKRRSIYKILIGAIYVSAIKSNDWWDIDVIARFNKQAGKWIR